MENYEGDFYNPETFEKTEIETEIPSVLVKSIDESLNKVDDFFVTPIIVKPEDKSVTWGVISMDNKKKYRISITHYE